jgi:hypothetical protein
MWGRRHFFKGVKVDKDNRHGLRRTREVGGGGRGAPAGALPAALNGARDASAAGNRGRRSRNAEGVPPRAAARSSEGVGDGGGAPLRRLAGTFLVAATPP